MPTLSVALLVHPHSPATSIFGPAELLRLAASISSAIDLKLEFVSEQSGPSALYGGIKLHIDASFEDTKQYDLIIVSALGHPAQIDLSTHAQAARWLSRQAGPSTLIASICSGAFLLGEAALADGHQITTHWLTADHFRARYPKAYLDIDQMVCRDGQLWSSGGAYAYQDLCLSLISHFWGQDVAEYCANVLLLEPPRTTQNRFTTLHAYKLHTDDKVKLAQAQLETEFGRELDNQALSQAVHLSERQLIRRFKHATGLTPNACLQKVRIEAAKKILRDSAMPITQIASTCGYSDAGYFRALFKKQTGHTPSDYRQRFAVRP